MIIRRDAFSHATNSASAYIAAAAISPSASLSSGSYPSPNPNEHITTTTINKVAAQEAALYIRPDAGTSTSNSATGHSFGGSAKRPLNLGSGGTGPSQQKEITQKETWDKERKQLLQKATNSQGDSVERLVANYLAV